MTDRSSDAARCAAIGRRVGLAESRGFLVPWDLVERNLDSALPDAYKAFIECFGPGRFSDELKYLTPGIECGAEELVYQTQREHERWSSAPALPVVEAPPFPEPGGELVFAAVGDDALALWRTAAEDPNAWGIVVKDGCLDGDLEFVGDFLDLVVAMLEEAPEVEGLEYYPELIAVFVPGDGSVSEGYRGQRLEPISRFAAGGAP